MLSSTLHLGSTKHLGSTMHLGSNIHIGSNTSENAEEEIFVPQNDRLTSIFTIHKKESDSHLRLKNDVLMIRGSSKEVMTVSKANLLISKE